MHGKWDFLEGWHICKNDFDDPIEAGEYPVEDILLIQKGEFNLDLGWYGGPTGRYCIYFFKGSWLKGELMEKFSSRNKHKVFKRMKDIVFQLERGTYQELEGYVVNADNPENTNDFGQIPDFNLRSKLDEEYHEGITISKVSKAGDFLLTQTLAHQIWTQHYTPIIGAKQVAYMLDKFQSVKTMQKQVGEGYEYYLVYDNEEPVGYFSFLPEKERLFLSKIYVLAEMRGNGIGRKTMEFITQQALERGLNFIRLTVNKYNTKSIDAYLKMGFEKVRPVVFDIGQGFIMDDYEMVKAL